MADISTVTIRDHFTGQTVTCEPGDIATALADWYPDPHEDVRDAIADLQRAVCCGEPTGSYKEYLGVGLVDG
jgi:hypothetical protein